MKRMRRRPDFQYNKMCRRQDLSNKMRRRLDFLTQSSRVLCPVKAVFFSTNHSSESSSFKVGLGIFDFCTHSRQLISKGSISSLNHSCGCSHAERAFGSGTTNAER